LTSTDPRKDASNIAACLFLDASVLPFVYRALTQVIATLAVLAEKSLIQASIQTMVTFSGWMTKPAIPV